MTMRLWHASRITGTRTAMCLFFMGAALFAVSPCRAQGPAPTRPDVEIQQISVVGTTSQVRIRYRGFARSGATRVKLVNIKPDVGNAGGSQVISIGSLAPGQSITSKFPQVFRNGTLIAHVDFENRVAESDERNNRVTKVLRDSRQRPDLNVAISKIDKNKDSVFVFVTNGGSSTSRTTVVQLWAFAAGSRELATRTFTVPPVNAGEVKPVRVTFGMPDATRIVMARVDPFNQITELNENNNQHAKSAN